jgi:hypothetical protein
MRGKSVHLKRQKEMNVITLQTDHYKMNEEEKLIFRKMRQLFKQLRELPQDSRKDSLVTLCLTMNAIHKTNEENKLIPQAEKKCQRLNNRMVSFEGYINISRYDLAKEVALYDFKINHEKVPFLLSSQLFLTPSFDIYHVQKHSDLVITSLESQLHLQRLLVAGKGILRYKKNEDLTIDLSRRHELTLV